MFFSAEKNNSTEERADMFSIEKFERIVSNYEGRITARNDEGTEFRVEFEWHTRSAGFYDDMICRDWAEVMDNTNAHVAVKITK